MRIMGIDPGLRVTGYGVIDFMDHKVKLLEAGMIEPKEKDLIQNRIHRIYQNLDALLLQYQPQIMVLEKLYAHYKHPTTACILGHVRGVICLLCAQRNIRLIEHSVKRIRKAIVGNGNATKEQTKRVVPHLLKMDKRLLALVASAPLARALGHTYMNR